MAWRAHRDRDLHGLLARTGGADLERLLADDEVVADLELIAPNGHDFRARDVARGQVGIERRSRPIVRAIPNGHRCASSRAGQAEVADAAVAGSCECMRPTRWSRA